MTTEILRILLLSIVMMCAALVLVMTIIAQSEYILKVWRRGRGWLGNKISGKYGEGFEISQHSKYTGPEDISKLRISLIEKAEKIQIPRCFQISYSHILIAAALKGKDVSSYHVMIETSNEAVEVPLYAYRAVRETLARFC